MKTLLSEKKLAQQFLHDIESIATQLIQVYSLKFRQQVDTLSSPIMRWLDFRFRYIDPFPRGVVYSSKFPKSDLPPKAANALLKIVRLIKSGSDINPYQGRGLILRNDSSGESKVTRTDLLWANWGIHHFHLSDDPIPSDRYFSKPADYLLFCLVGGDVVALIDVIPHPDKEGFSNPDLIDTVFENWPGFMEHFHLPDLLPGDVYTQQEIRGHWINGLQVSLSYKGKVYMGPGLGITTASVPVKLISAHGHLLALIKDLAELTCDPIGPFRTPEINELSCTPRFSISLTPKGLAVFEHETLQAFLLPTPPILGSTRNPLETIPDLMLPEWARLQMIGHSQVTNT